MRFRDAGLTLTNVTTSYLKNLGNFFTIYLNKDYIYLKSYYTSVQFYFWTQLTLPPYKKKNFFSGDTTYKKGITSSNSQLYLIQPSVSVVYELSEACSKGV